MIKRVEKENRKNTNIDFLRKAHASEWVPGIGPKDRIVVLEGNSKQRNAVALRGIDCCLGKVGVIVIHNNDSLEEELNLTPQRNPQLINNCPGLKVSFVNNDNMGYEPLYEMSVERALDVFYPDDGTNGITGEQRSVRREVLEKYLHIVKMETGNLSLNYLKTLCDLSPEEFRYHHLGGFSEKEAEDIYRTLITDSKYRDVRADINAFATTCSDRIWHKQAGDEFNTVSLVSAVRAVGLISVKLSSNNNTILNYLADEINYLIDMGESFLLVVDNLSINKTRLQEVLKNPYLKMATIVSEESGGDLADGENGSTEYAIINKATKVIVFKCANVEVAKKYSAMVGQYLEVIVGEQKGKHRGAFDFFSGHDKGIHLAKELADRVKPTKLAALGQGALLVEQISENSSNIELVDYFEY